MKTMGLFQHLLKPSQSSSHSRGRLYWTLLSSRKLGWRIQFFWKEAGGGAGIDSLYL